MADVDTTTEPDDDLGTDTGPDTVTPKDVAPKPTIPTQATTGPDDDDTTPVGPDAATKAALAKANREAKERRVELNALRTKLAELEAANASESERAIIKARQEAAQAAIAEWKPAVVSARAEAALSAAGCTDPEKQAKMLRLIDQTGVELDDKGKVIGGLSEQVDSIKDMFPEAFAPPRPARVTAREVDAGDKKPPAVVKSVGEQLAERLGYKQ